MKILHVIPSLAASRGGASKAAIDMVLALRLSGVDVEIACTNDDGPSELDVELNNLTEFEGVPVRFFQRYSPARNNRLTNALREFAYSRDLKLWLHTNINHYDLVHVHALFSFPSTFTMRLARKRNVPYIAHPIGSLDKWSLQQSAIRKAAYLALMERANLRHANRVHFTADSERDQAVLVEPKLKTIVIPLGLKLPLLLDKPAVKLREQFQITHEDTVILYISRLHPKKGLELLLRSLAQQIRPFRLLIAGSGDAEYANHLEQLVKQLHLGERVNFLGYIEGQQKTVALQGSDLFALSSHSENFGIAVLEALANSTAVLVSEGVALSAQVADNKLGVVCELSEQSVSSSLRQLLGDHQKLEELGFRGRQYVEQNHDWQDIAAQMREMYRIVIEEVASKF